MQRDQINIRIDKELRIYLLSLDDYSKYIKSLINKDRIDKGDPKLIDQEIKRLNERIKDLNELKKLKSVDQDKINELVAYHAPGFKQNAMHRSESQRFKFIERVILPNIKKLGYAGTVKEIDDLLINWPDDKED